MLANVRPTYAHSPETEDSCDVSEFWLLGIRDYSTLLCYPRCHLSAISSAIFVTNRVRRYPKWNR